MLGLSGKPAASPEQAEGDLEVFVRQGCTHCERAKPTLARLQRQYPGLTIAVYDIGKDPRALRRLQKLAENFGITPLGVPAFYGGGQLLIGFDADATTGKQLEELLGRPPPEEDTPSRGVCPLESEEACLPESGEPDGREQGIHFPFVGYQTLSGLGLPAFTLLIGLLDGFNPCAMWVLLFLLSLLANLRDRRKMFLLAGTFVLVSGLVYFVFMAAWLNVFLVVGYLRPVQVVLGLVAMGVGLVNVKEFWAFGKGLSLTIPETAKPGLYARVRKILAAEHLGGAMVGIIVLASVVNLIEFVCTAGFPALFTQVLSQQDLSFWGYYGYLGLYILAYMADDALMVTIAIFTLSHRKLQEREGRWLKLISGLVMMGLGAVLLLAPEWLL
jgi:thiol-disulfide isomerase/thioredoxin